MTQRYFYMAVAAFLVMMSLSPGPAWAAVGCELNDPKRDVARLFPESTGYKTIDLDIQKAGGQKLLAKVEAKLRDKLHGLYETIDVPYTLYDIYKNKKRIGYIHGVTQKGRFGGINIFLVLDLEERIKELYIQKMTGEYAGKFRAAEFTSQFIGLTLGDFEQYDVLTGKTTGKVSEINNPAPEAEYDFKYILRGTKKNLILANEFIRILPDLPAKSAKKGAPTK